MPTYPFYSVKVRHSIGAMPTTDKGRDNHFEQSRTSFFPYDRFYLFHSDDTQLVNRMFYVYLVHTMTPEITRYLNDLVDVVMVTSLGPSKMTRKVTTITERGQQQTRVPWHVGRSKLENYMLVVPTYTINLKFSNQKKHADLLDGYALGYVRSGYHLSKTAIGDIFFEETPKLVINKEVIPNPCMFCARYLDGFQAGTCKFGTLSCYRENTIFTPYERKTIQDGDVLADGVVEV